MEIQGKTVLVTGASSGIGSAIAKAMAQAGAAAVLLIARRENDLKKVAGEIGASGGNGRPSTGTRWNEATFSLSRTFSRRLKG